MCVRVYVKHHKNVTCRLCDDMMLTSATETHAEEGEKLEKNVEEVTKKLLEKEKPGETPPTQVAKGGRKPGQELREETEEEEHPELWVPGKLLLICGGRAPGANSEDGAKSGAGREGHVLLKGHDGTQFGRIVLSSTMLSDHKCISIYYALRDVLKGLPKSGGGSHNLSI